MIVTTRGCIESKQMITNPQFAGMSPFPMYRLTVRFYDPQTLAFCREHIHCSAQQYEHYQAGDWVSLRLNTGRWKLFQHWIISAQVLSLITSS